MSRPRRSLPIWALLLVVAGCGAGGAPPAMDTAAGPDTAAGLDTAAGSDTVIAPDTASRPDATAPADTAGDGAVPRDAGDAPGDVPWCPPPEPPAAALVRAGPQEDGGFVTIGGRAALPAGPSVVVEGFPTDVAVHPLGHVAWVSSTSRDDRRLLVFDVATRAVIQDIDRGEAFYGLAVAPDGARLYASGGAAARVDAYAVAPDGTLTPDGSVPLGEGYPSGLALSDDGATLWVGLFDRALVVEVDTATLRETRRFRTEGPVWDVAAVPGRAELYASDLAGEVVSVIDLLAGATVAAVAAPTSPAGLVAAPDGDRVWAAVAGADVVAAIDTASREILAWVPVAERDWVGVDGAPLPNSNVNALAWDAARGRLYATRGADNAVSVLDGATMELLGALPGGWYPTAAAVTPDGATLVVAAGKGGGTGPSEGQGAKERAKGRVAFVDLEGLDLAAATAAVRDDFARPLAAFPFDCVGRFPIPPDGAVGVRSPIEHVILIVKENKTFDCVFGDLAGELDVAADPSLVRWGEEITPNQHALARQFTLLDNFYTETPNSDTGHLFLTATHLTEYIERVWLDSGKLDGALGFQISEAATPAAGNFFTHLMEHGVDIRVYGEIVGMFAETEAGERPFQRSDSGYPGGPFTNYAVRDEDKARHVADRIAAGELATFTFLLLPNDHTVGTDEGMPTPESMVADNDVATGIVVDALGRSPFWERSVVFVLQDDPQGCEDHVDALRSFLIVVSPWARRRHVSHAHASFLSVFATIERILGVPPIGRPDAAAAPLWDVFTDTPDPTPYEVVPRRVPEELNRPDLPGAAASARMDFRSPDRNPDLAVVLDAYRLWRMGRIPRAEADRRIRARFITPERRELLEEEAVEEATAFDADWARYQAWLRGQGGGAE